MTSLAPHSPHRRALRFGILALGVAGLLGGCSSSTDAPAGAAAPVARYAAVEYGPRGIRVNAVIPGLILTDLTAPMMDVPGAVEAFSREVPMGRCGVPQDISDVIMWLSAPNYITGVALPVSGGNQLTRLPRIDELPVASPV